MRSVARGDTFTITSNGQPVGELTPLRRRRFVSAAAAIEMFRSAPSVDAEQFRADVDALAAQDVEPRG